MQAEFSLESVLTVITRVHLGTDAYRESHQLIEFMSGEESRDITYLDGERVEIISKMLLEQHPWLVELSRMVKSYCETFNKEPFFCEGFRRMIEVLPIAYPCILTIAKPELFPSPSTVTV